MCATDTNVSYVCECNPNSILAYYVNDPFPYIFHYSDDSVFRPSLANIRTQDHSIVDCVRQTTDARKYGTRASEINVQLQHPLPAHQFA